MRFNVLISSKAEKALVKLPKNISRPIRDKINYLACNPYPIGSSSVIGRLHTYRLRHGKYRIIYEINDKQLRILVIKIAPRGDVYKDL